MGWRSIRKKAEVPQETAVIAEELTRGGDIHGAARVAKIITANDSAETRHLVVSFMTGISISPSSFLTLC